MQMRLSLIFFHVTLVTIAILSHVICITAADWERCQGVSTAFNVTEMAITPNPIQPGAPVKFSLFTEHDVDVEDGLLTATVNYMGFRVFHKKGDLCLPLQCPISRGRNILDFIESMPAFLPPGRMTMTLHGRRTDDLDLFCVKVHFHKQQPKQDPSEEEFLTQRLGLLDHLGLGDVKFSLSW